MNSELMATPKRTCFTSPSFEPNVYIIVGGYGSGKSEVAVNMAKFIVEHRPDNSQPVAIADLDIVNPYFRSREAVTELKAMGIRSITPEGGHFYADLPIIVPEIKGAVQQRSGYVILDVGGDDVGARVLRSLAGAFEPGDYELLLVHNANRPFTSDLESSKKTMMEIQAASGLTFTGIISNSHLMDDTTPETIYQGLSATLEIEEALKLKLCFISVDEKIVNDLDSRKINVPLLRLNRSLLKPWERKK